MNEEVFDELIDPNLEANYDVNDMQLLIACAAAAVRQTARSRPSMNQVNETSRFRTFVSILKNATCARPLGAGCKINLHENV